MTSENTEIIVQIISNMNKLVFPVGTHIFKRTSTAFERRNTSSFVLDGFIAAVVLTTVSLH